MPTAGLIPTPDAIPVAWGWLEILLVFTFAAHILLMNAVVGGALVCAVRSVSYRSDTAVRELSHALPTLFALTVNFGVAPLLFAQMLYGQFFYTSSVLMAVYWLSVVFLVIAAYSGLYVFRYRYDEQGRSRWVIFAVCGVLLFVGFIFTNNITLMQSPQEWSRYFEEMGGTLLNTGDPTLFPRYLHFMLAALAVGGLTLALLFALRRRKGTVAPAEAERQIRFGMGWFSVCTAFQLLVGGIFFGSLPLEIRRLFLGDSTLHTGALIVGLVLVAITLHYSVRRRVFLTAVTLVCTVFAMSGIRALVRAEYFSPYFSVTELPVRPEYSPMILFFLSLLGGLLCIWYMLRISFRNGKEV